MTITGSASTVFTAKPADSGAHLMASLNFMVAPTQASAVIVSSLTKNPERCAGIVAKTLSNTAVAPARAAEPATPVKTTSAMNAFKA
jgi:hypothetical protein